GPGARCGMSLILRWTSLFSLGLEFRITGSPWDNTRLILWGLESDVGEALENILGNFSCRIRVPISSL
ncbi:12687_t:CDS:2, partial [Gigaspora rosea]